MMGMVSYKNIEKPSLFIFGILIINAYIPGYIGAAIPTGWIFLLIIIPILICFYEFKITNAHIYGILFLSFAALSLIWTENFNIAIFYLAQLLILACVFCLGSRIDVRLVIKGMIIGLISSDIIASIQYFKHEPVVYTLPNTYAGLFVNPNIFCEVSAVLLICAVVFKLWVYIPFTLPAIIFVHSRAALLGLGIALGYWTWKINKMLFLILVIGIGTWAFVGFKITSIFERFDLWKDAIRGLNLFGRGIGSFEILYPFYAININTELARPKYAHNDLLQLIFEFGIGSILVLIMFYNILRVRHNAQIILFVVVTMSMFTYSFHMPIIAFIWFLVAGHINSNSGAIWLDGTYRGSDLPIRIKGK